MAINVCKTIECPYFCPNSEGFGCRKYDVALLCHLIHPEQGITRSGFEQTTQYVIYAESADGLKEINEQYLKNDESYQVGIKFRDRLDDLTDYYPNRVL